MPKTKSLRAKSGGGAAITTDGLPAAVEHHRSGRLKEAEAGYRILLLTEPNQATALRLLGLIVLDRGQSAQAAEYFNRAISLRPDMVEAHVGLGNAYAAQGKLQEAEAALGRALALDPKNIEALNNLGNNLQATRRFDEAEAVFRRAIAINSGFAELHNNLGNALQAQKKTDEAIAAFRAAIALKPDFSEAHSNLGNMLKAGNELPEAVALYRRALELNPRYVDAHNNLGNALFAQGFGDEAIATYRRSQKLQPDQGDAYFYESLAQLGLGNLETGFAQYEARWKSILRHARRIFPQPLWLGEPELKDKIILLHAEQGLGDTLQFSRYAILAASRGATVFLEVQPALKTLLSGLPGVSAVFAKGEPLPAFDFHCPLLSLPHAFHTTLDTVPPPGPALAVSAERAVYWRRRLPPGARPRVGLMWSGNPHHVSDRNRSISLEDLRPLFARGNADFFSLQKDYRSDEERQRAISWGIADLSEEIADFDSTAALVSQLDLVISVDTSMAHLAGVLDRPVWLLLMSCPDWRWLLQRTDSPWYPRARLFRQERPGDWTKPVEAAGAALGGWTKD